jgi:AmmeMemoRadiSam system protein B
MDAPKSVRHSVVAGTWYPGSESGLASTIDQYLERVEQPPIEGELLAVISPHAGYAYSGQTAAYAYHQLQGRRVDTVVLMGPSHRAWVGDYAVNTEEAYETPLGLIPLDQEWIADLSGRVSLQRIRRDAEHSLEIQLPFLQRVVGEFTLVPIMMSADDAAVASRLALALADIARLRGETGRRTLFVASSDLHHVEDYGEVVRRDQAVVEAIAAYDLESIATVLMGPRSTVCGRIPILAALHAAQALGADSARVLYHTNSGDVSGDRRSGQYTVGYMAAAIYKSGPAGTAG